MNKPTDKGLPTDVALAEDKDKLAEWNQLADDTPPADAVAEDGRILDQKEIDSLLGFDDSGGSEKTGIMELINSALVNYERLPMLDVVFDRLVRLMSTS
jgi:flagellar motor switch protein FliM